MKSTLNREVRVISVVRRRLAAAALILITGCVAGNSGTLRQDTEVTRLFETYQVRPDHLYYVSGTESLPDGLLAIDNRYRLRSDLWRKIDMTPELLRRYVAAINWAGMHITEIPVGAAVLGPGGEKIGLWYSDINFSFVELLEDGEVRVKTPASIRNVRRDLQRSRDKNSN